MKRGTQSAKNGRPVTRGEGGAMEAHLLGAKETWVRFPSLTPTICAPPVVRVTGGAISGADWTRTKRRSPDSGASPDRCQGEAHNDVQKLLRRC